MPAVFVHGVPDTAELWDPIRAELRRDDTIALRLPGFGAPIPDGFECTKEEYADWIADEIRALDGPVDVVGHDWGSTLVQRVVTTRPELVRSYVLVDGGVSGPMKWHDIAQQWQTPEVGEQIMDVMTPDVIEATMRDAGHPDPAACGRAVDDTMKSAILRLYRSAVDVGAEWAPGDRGRERPVLVIWGRDDPFAKPKRGEEIAAGAGAPVEVIDGGHWAIFGDPAGTARRLEEFWASV